MTTKQKTAAESIAEKICGNGPMMLTKAESDELRRIFKHILENKAWLDYQLAIVREAHIRHGVEVVHHFKDDGTDSYTLQPTQQPQPTTETVN